MRQRPSGIIKQVKAPAIDWDSDDTYVRARLRVPTAVRRRCAPALRPANVLRLTTCHRRTHAPPDCSTESDDSADEQETTPGAPQSGGSASSPGRGLQGRKLQMGYGGGVQGGGASFRTPEQEAEWRSRPAFARSLAEARAHALDGYSKL